MEPIDITKLAPPAQKVLSPGAPPPLRLMAAKGIMPGVKAQDIVAVLVLLSSEPAGQVAETAAATLAALPAPVLQAALGAPLEAAVIDALARANLERKEVIEPLLRQPSISLETVAHLASKGSEAVTELVATNEERVLAHPRLIELLYLNQSTRMSTADRLVELAVRHGLELHGIAAWEEAKRAIEGELIAEPTDEPLPEDELFKETAQLAEQLATGEDEDTHVEDDEGTEKVKDKFLPLSQRLAEMTVSQKIRRAMLGTKEERMLLVRDRNKLIAEAAVRSEQMQEPDIVLISRNRSVADTVLRIIGTSPEWLRSYQIKKHLVENAKTPIGIAQKLITQLREADLRQLARDKNVPSAVQLAARRHLSRRKH